MMEQPPSFLDLELSDHDVARDIEKIIIAMDYIRTEKRLEQEINEDVDEEYLHLAFRLASGIQSIADSTIVNLLDVALDRVHEHPSLMGYDSSQDNLWGEYDPIFNECLDEVTIRILGDSFRGLQDKHHLFNALKYLSSDDERVGGEKIRQYICSAFPPYNEHSAAAFEKRFKRAFGRKFRDLIEGTSIRIGLEKVETRLEMAGFFGFANVKTKGSYEDYRMLSEKYKHKVIHFQDSQTTIEIPTDQQKTSFLANYHPVMEELAKHPLPEKVEQNLTWSVSNHHTQGNDFKHALLGAEVKKDGFGKQEYFNRNDEVLFLYDDQRTGAYQKLSSLACHFGKRTALTLIRPSKATNESYFSAIQNAVAPDEPLQESQFNELMEKTNAIHLHLSRFSDLEKIEDYTVTR